ncbi:hypothetical protein D9619_003030 [Psilocybe cf. subviscida]|uniref:3-carboxymuconate cyclase n=1 Tax=Psilocybe cf. subviscida TaxID=2480587 RepID=A0A8H5EUW4_9AGAR|nr:hypothetical protein D9619_003030 [Psilocybe cf. subviscida]
MKLSISSIVLALSFATTGVFGSPVPTRSRQMGSAARGKTVAGAAYLITNEPSGNQIIAADINSDGTLTLRRAIDAGGIGAHGITDPNGPDPLFSQGAIKASAAGNIVAAVNSGSNTLSVFNINPTDATNLQMIGQPVGSNGQFPMSLAINKAGNMVCALNGGEINGVSCFKVDKTAGLVPIANTVRSLNLNQTTPATGPAGTASHVVFSEDNSQLIASVKGVPPTPGFLAVWDVAADGSLSQDFQSIAPASGGLLPFSMTVIDGQNAILATDAGLGFDIFDLAAASSDASSSGDASVAATAADDTAVASNVTSPATSDVAATADNSTVSASGSTDAADNSTAVAASNATIAARAAPGKTAVIVGVAPAAPNSPTAPVSNVTAVASATTANATVSATDATADASNSTVSAADATATSSNSTVASDDSTSASTGDRSSANAISGQSATCWSSFSPKTGNFFLTDIGTATITEVNVDANLKGTIVKQYPQAAGSGTIDNDVATVGKNDFLYVLAANASSIDVLALPAPGKAKNIQKVDIAGPAKAAGIKVSAFNLQGMTTFIRK